MGHSSGHHHGHEHSGAHSHRLAPDPVSGAFGKVLAVTAGYMLIEAAAGFYANSLALLSDSAHMFSDVAAICLSYFAYWFSRRPSTPRMSFGYYRAEILGALASGLSIWGLVGVLVYEAYRRLQAPPEVQGPVVIAVAAVGLGVNLFSMRVLHSAREHSLNVRGAYLHVLMDCLGSVAALVSGGVIVLTGWRAIDPLVTFISAVLMLFGSWDLIRESVAILMESVPTHVSPEQVKKDLRAIPGVIEVHDLHIWSVTSGRLALSVHLVADSGEKVLHTANEVLEARFGIRHTTIQVEHPERFRSERCYDCART